MVVVLLGSAIACVGEQAAQSGGSLAQDQAAVLVPEAVDGGTADLSRLGCRFPEQLATGYIAACTLLKSFRASYHTSSFEKLSSCA